jgi:hypothetical protein
LRARSAACIAQEAAGALGEPVVDRQATGVVAVEKSGFQQGVEKGGGPGRAREVTRGEGQFGGVIL